MASPNVLFHEEDVSYSLTHPDAVVEWLVLTCESEKQKLGDVTYVFCSDEYLYKMNVEYLQHDTYTDIITFDYSENDVVAGDLFISIDRIKDNAQKYDVSVVNELHRVMVHGVLHLLGYKDKTPAEQAVMTEKEDFYLSLRTFL